MMHPPPPRVHRASCARTRRSLLRHGLAAGRGLLAGLGVILAFAGSPVPAAAALARSVTAAVLTPQPSPDARRAQAEDRMEEVVRLLAVYRRMPGLLEIEVRMEGRILELRGTALTAEDRERALGHAERIVTGVDLVDARGLVVETDVRRRLEPAMDRIREKGIAFLRFLPSLLLGVFLLALGGIAAWWVGRRDAFFRHLSRNPFARNLFRQSLRVGILLIALLLALDLMGVTTLVGAVFGAAGVVGIAVGFAFRDIVENYLAGVLLSLRQPFAPQDHVQIAGEEGRVVRLTGRETVLMTLDGNHIRIPNATVFKAVITNLTRNPRRRLHFLIGIAPTEPLGRAIAVAREAASTVSGVLETPGASVRVAELQDSAVALRVAAWVDQRENDFSKVRSQVIRAVKEAFEDAGIATPPPEFGIRMLEAEPSEALASGTRGPQVAAPPGDRRAAPADREATPADREATPADREATPADREATPADREASPGGPTRAGAAAAPPAPAGAAAGAAGGRPSGTAPGTAPTAAPVADAGSATGPATGPPGPDLDLSPDRTIEDEIARELARGDEENLLNPAAERDDRSPRRGLPRSPEG